MLTLKGIFVNIKKQVTNETCKEKNISKKLKKCLTLNNKIDILITYF